MAIATLLAKPTHFTLVCFCITVNGSTRLIDLQFRFGHMSQAKAEQGAKLPPGAWIAVHHLDAHEGPLSAPTVFFLLGIIGDGHRRERAEEAGTRLFRLIARRLPGPWLEQPQADKA